MIRYFKFTRKTLKTEDGRVLHLIKAVKKFDAQGYTVYKGEIGGYVESEKNLSPYDPSWASVGSVIYGDAVVSYSYIGDSKIYENAHVVESRIYDSSVYGNAHVVESRIYDSSVYGNANVAKSRIENSSVFGKANVSKCEIINSSVSGEANVHGDVNSSRISENANIAQDSIVEGSQIGGNANICDQIENTILCK